MGEGEKFFEDIIWDDLDETQKILEKILPAKIQRKLEDKFLELIIANTNLPLDTVKELIQKFIDEIRKKIGDCSLDVNERYVAHGWRIEHTATGATLFTSSVSNSIAKTELSKETEKKLSKALSKRKTLFILIAELVDKFFKKI